MADYYRTLGVPRGATEKEIRSAFRKLARKHHPDVNDNDPVSEEKFKDINEAYTVLSDEDSRAKYDRYGDDWKRADQFGRGGRAGGMGGGGFSHFDFGGMRGGGGGNSSIFDQFFGGMGGTETRPQAPAEHKEPSLWKRRSLDHPADCKFKTADAWKSKSHPVWTTAPGSMCQLTAPTAGLST